MLQILRAIGIGKFRLLGNRLHLPDMLVEARDVSLVIGRVNNIRVRRIRRNVAGLASAHVIPV